MTTNSVNIDGFLNILDASVKNKVCRFVYAASSSTYGDSASLPKEESVIGKPLWPYAITKYVNELYADVFHKTYGINTIGLRYFNVFGRYQDPHGGYAAVIPKFVKNFIQLKPVLIHGDGSYSRDFTYIDNVIQANILAIETANTSALNQAYNIACGSSMTIKDLAQTIRQELSSLDPQIISVPIEYGKVRDGDVPHSLASIKKAHNLLEYHPEYQVKTGLKHSIKWYWENL